LAKLAKCVNERQTHFRRAAKARKKEIVWVAEES